MGSEQAEPPPFAISADRIFDGYRWHNHALILIAGGIVQSITSRDESASRWSTEVMPPGTILAPGFIDLQVNGGGGILLNDQPTPDAMRAIAQAHRRYGTTSCLPTLISDTRAKATAAIAAAKLLAGTDGILGLHLEGPFISRLRPGDSSGRLYSVRDKGRSGLARGAIRSRIVHGDSGARMRTSGICEDPRFERNSGVSWSQRGNSRHVDKGHRRGA